MRQIGVLVVLALSASSCIAEIELYAVVMAQTGEVQIHRKDVDTGQTTSVIQTELEAETPFGHGFTVGPDGDFYVVDADTFEIQRYDGETGAYLGVFAHHENIVMPYYILFGPDGDLYVSSTHGQQYRNQIYRFDGSTGEFVSIVAEGDHLGYVTAMAFGPDGFLYLKCHDPVVSIRRVDPEGVMEESVWRTFHEREDFGTPLIWGTDFGMHFGSDGFLYLDSGVGDTDGIARVHMGTGELGQIFNWDEDGSVVDFVMASDGTMFLRTWDAIWRLDSFDGEPRLLSMHRQMPDEPYLSSIALYETD